MSLDTNFSHLKYFKIFTATHIHMYILKISQSIAIWFWNIRQTKRIAQVIMHVFEIKLTSISL